jgi:membrane-associated protease RseP (regulator of RpoE activity)
MKIFLWALPIIIITHELGHLLIAKWVGCAVDRFSVGFGKPALKKKIGKTVYQITPWILGGYCALRNETSFTKDPEAFTNLSYGKKVAISLAGVAVNVIIGSIAMLIGLHLHSFTWYVFGYYNLAIGLTNLLPFPALDGSYPILLLCEKIWGKEKGLRIMDKIVTVGFIIVMTLNVLSIPLLVKYWSYVI